MEKRKGFIDKSKVLKEQLEQARFNEDKYYSLRQFGKAAELKYSIIPNLKKKLLL